MSVNLSIKGVPDVVAERLRARAARNHRSLQGELLAIIDKAAAETEADAAAAVATRSGTIGSRRGTKTIEQIAAEHRALYPQPFRGLPLAVDIIRKDRDSR